MTAISEQKMDEGYSIYSPSTYITDECRSARNEISGARERYLERILSATNGDINDLDTSDEENTFEFTTLFESTGQLTVLKEKSQSYSTKEAEFKQQEEDTSDEENTFEFTPLFESTGQLTVLKEKSQSYSTKEAEFKQQEEEKSQSYSTKEAEFKQQEEEDSEEDFNDATKIYKYPFENLVLKGGGVKGIAYCGLIKVLEERGILQQMKRFAGTSAGAITAALLAVGYNSYDAEKVLGVDFEKLVKDSSRWTYLPHLFKGYGVNTGKRFDRFIGDLLALKTRNPDVTFEEVYDRFNKELCLVVVNVDTSEEMYCHVKTTPQMPVRLAVRMSMSIPVLFQAVKHKHSYFVDGGLLCNYPIHCFDGWFLSMEMENRFFNKIPSLDDLQEITCFENSFKKDPENKTTIGGMVYCDGENISYRKMLEKSTGVPLGKLPDTALARKYVKGKVYGRNVKNIYKETVKAVVEFYKVLRENELTNGRIIKNGFMAAFNTPSFTVEYKKLLFGDEYKNSEKAWTAVNKHKSVEVQFTDITNFIETTPVSMLEAFKGHERRDTGNVLAFSGAMILGLSESTMQHFFKSTDVERSVGINTWYIQTKNFKLEEGDKQFLTNQGRGSTMKFLQNFLKNNQLRKLTAEEMDKIEIPDRISVDESKLNEIIDL